MQRVLSTNLYLSQKLVPALLAEIEQSRISQVEIYCAAGHFDYRSRQEVRELSDWFGDHKLVVHSLHAPTSRDFAPGRESGVPISIADTERVRRLDAVDEIKRALEVAEHIPFRFLVLHLGAGREAADPRRYHAAFNSLEHLAVFAKQRGVTIALENTPGELSSPSNLRHFLEDTRLEVKLCFDAGHAHLEDGVAQGFETMREFVVTTHVHDNRGEKDEHLLPFEGTIDWSAALKLFGSAAGSGSGIPVVIELLPGHAKSLQQVLAAFERLENARAAKN